MELKPFVTIERSSADGTLHFTVVLDADADPGVAGIAVADLVRHLGAALTRARLTNGETGGPVDAAEAEALVWEWAERERENPTDAPTEMTLEQLGRFLGIRVFQGDPRTVPGPLGCPGASPYAQACAEGVCVVDWTCAYSACHELAHILEGFEDEDDVLERQAELAGMLREPLRSRATP